MSVRTTIGTAVLAFAAGALVAWLAASATIDPAASGAPPQALPSPRAGSVTQAPPAPRKERARAGTEPAAPAAPLVAPDVTDEEAAFLRKALEAERLRRRESAIRAEDDGLKVMDRYLTHGAEVADLVGSFDAMRSHVRIPESAPRRVEASGERTAVDPTKDLAGATVIEFGPGTFVLGRGDGKWNVRREDITALEIRGAGMDKTKLVGPGWAFLCVDEAAKAQNLVLRDLTIDAAEQEQIVLDARGGLSAVLERVRIAGWQTSGHAAPLGVTGSAFLACRDCEFVGPGRGYVLSLRGPALATIERCRFLDADVAFIGPGGRERSAVVSVRDCTFEAIRLADSRIRGDKMAGVQLDVRGGTAAAGAASWTEEQRRKWWGAQFASSLDGLTFTSTAPLFPFSEFIRAADLAAVAGLRDIVAIDAIPGRRGAPVELDFYLWDREKSSVVRRTRRLLPSALEEVTQEPRRGMRGRSVKSDSEVDGLLPFAELMRKMPLAADDEVTLLELRPLSPQADGRQVTWLTAQTPGGMPPVVVDARTGEVLQKR